MQPVRIHSLSHGTRRRVPSERSRRCGEEGFGTSCERGHLLLTYEAWSGSRWRTRETSRRWIVQREHLRTCAGRRSGSRPFIEVDVGRGRNVSPVRRHTCSSVGGGGS
jgi:hypothetical protein